MALSVLLVEDNPADVVLLQEALETTGEGERVNVTPAKALANGLERLSRDRYDAVLLDLSLPDSHGIETVVQIQRRFPEIPIVVVSGSDDESLISSALRSGVEDYVVKGRFDGPLLSRVIWYAITRHRALDERRNLDERLFQIRKMQSLAALAGGVAHDFNNLLAAILGTANLIARDLPVNSPSGQRAREIEATALKASDLTRQLLAFTGKAEGKVESTSLNELVSEALALLRPFLSDRARLHLELSDRLPRIEADAGQLRQVAVNLAVNACDALGDGQGVLIVRTGTQRPEARYLEACAPNDLAPGRSCVYLEVQDDGSGLDEDDRSRIFDPFFTTKPDHRGLGLSAVLGIVQHHGGAVHVDSVARRGTTIRALFPVADAFPAPSKESGEGEGASVEARTRVLVVDDNDTVRNVTAALLQREHYDTLLASNGGEALRLLDEHTVDVVLLDMVMPGTSGQEVLAEIRKTMPGLPVILISGYDAGNFAGLAARDPATELLRKPFVSANLLDLLHRVVNG